MSQAKSRAMRILWRWMLRPLAWIIGGVVTIVAVVLLALDLRPVRDFVRVQLNRALAETFQGQLIIDRIGTLRLDVIRGVDARVLDAQARQVLMVKGLRVQSNWPELVRDLIGNRPLVVKLSPTVADYVDAHLVVDKEGVPTLASAFNPRHPEPASAPPGKPTTVLIRGFKLKRAWVHGGLPALPLFDVDLLGVAGQLRSSASGLDAEVSLDRLTARSLPKQLDLDGNLRARVNLPATGADHMVGSAQFAGTLAQAPTTLDASLNARRIEARLHSPDIPSSFIQKFIPNARIQGPTGVVLNVRGELPELNLTATVRSPAARLEATARATLADTTAVACHLVLSELDLGAWLGGPRTRLAATATANVAVAPGGPITGDYRVEVPRGTFGAHETPAASTAGKLSRRSDGATMIKGSLDVTEPGISAKSQYQVELPAVGGPVLAASITARFDEPPRLRRIADIRTSGTLSARAELKLGQQRRLNANAKVHLGPFAHPSAELRSVEAAIAATGSLSAPHLRLDLDAREGNLAGNPVSRLQIDAVGDTAQLLVRGLLESGQRRLMLETRLAMNEGLTLDGPSIELSDRDGPVLLKAIRVRVLPERIDVNDLSLEGLGKVRASGSVRGDIINAQFEAQELDLARVSRLLNTQLFEHGMLSMTGQLKGSAGNFVGRVQCRATELARGGLRGGQLDLDLEVGEHKLNGRILGKLGASRLQAELNDIDLPKPPFTRERLSAMKGAISLDGDLNLRQLTPALVAAGVPIEQAAGQVAIELRAQHARAGSEPPTILMHLRSMGLKLVEQRADVARIDTPTEAKQTKPRSLEGIDADIRLNLEPTKGRAQLGATLFDRLGPVLTLVGESESPGNATALMQELEHLPLRFALRIPERALEELPMSIRPRSMQGRILAALDAQGTLREPRLRAQVALQKFFPRGGKHFINFHADAKYDSVGGSVDATAVSMRGGRAELRTSWKGNLLRGVREQGSERSFFELQTDLALERFPLGIVPALFERQIRGPLSGWVKLRGLGNDAVLEAQLDGSGLVVNRVRQPQLKAKVLANNQELRVAFDARQEKGSAHVELQTNNRWGSRLVPEVDPRAKLRIVADRFQLETLSPLFLRYLSTLEGELDANLSAQLDPEQPKFEGRAGLRKGVVQLPQIGQRFSDIRADVVIGNNEVRVNALQARGVTGRVTGEAVAKLRGTELKEVSASVDIREQEKLPVTLEGVEVGEAWGHVDLAYASSGEGSEIKVDVPRLHLLMPEVAQNSVQDLAPPEDIRVGTHRADGKFVAIPLQPLEGAPSDDETPTTTRIRVRLGDSVWIERGHQLRVQLAGELGIESGAEQKVAGRIEVRSGKLDVSGKRFELERGVVTFEPGSDPSNPTVTATARWDSPVGYVVYADYSGTAQDGKLKLHSEPVLTQDEILSLLMFGSPEGNIASSGSAGTTGGLGSSGSSARSPGNRSGAANASSGSGSPNAAGAAVSIAGSTATKGLNRALSDVTSLDVSTRIDTSTGSSRPELVVQLTPRLTTRLTRAIGEPAPGQSLDRTFLTLELRLKRAWSASAVIGDKGASRLDLVWRKRY